MTSSAPPDTQRMAALAQVAGGIAPALGDMLTVIRGHAGVMLDKSDQDAVTRESLRRIYAAAERACSLVRQLQIFGQEQPAPTAAMDLNGCITETGRVIGHLMGEEISVELRLASSLPLILANPEMMEQILLILAVNARDAMPAGGRLRFETELVEMADDAVKDHPAGRSGKFVVLRVADTGHGIAPEILPRIFEPFFTTRAGGRSTGLGLATAFGIVRQHHGWMDVESVVQGGSIFQVTLPAAPPDAVAKPSGGSDAGNQSGNQTILLVEDEADVREFTAMILSEHGYRVLQAGSGQDAMEVWKWHGPRVRLLLTDLVLEGNMNGLELAARLRAETPGLRVICTSGYKREDLKRFPELAGGYRYLQKPCRPKALVAAVRALLDATEP